MATFKYIAQTKESDVTLSDVLKNGTESKGTSYYNDNADKQYVYVENAPLVKFLAKDVFQEGDNSDAYVKFDINEKFELKTTPVDDILKYTPDSQTAEEAIKYEYENVTKDTFQNALVSEVIKTGVGKRFLIAIPSTRDDAKSEWERKDFINLFKLADGADFKPAINVGEPSDGDGNVIITFNDSVKVAINDYKDGQTVIAEGGTIQSDGENLTVVCTNELYNNIQKNGISSIKLEIVYTRTLTPVEMLPGEGFVGE